MPTNNDETPKKTLREKTQSFRNKALHILRMEYINGILQSIFGLNKELSRITKNIENLTGIETDAEKITARAEHKMSKLDNNDPDYEDKKTKAVIFIETETERQIKVLEQVSSDIKFNKNKVKDYIKQIERLDKEIEAAESGDTKMSIDEINDLTQSLIAKS